MGMVSTINVVTAKIQVCDFSIVPFNSKFVIGTALSVQTVVDFAEKSIEFLRMLRIEFSKQVRGFSVTVTL